MWPWWSTVVAAEPAAPAARSPSPGGGPYAPVTLTDAGPLIALIDGDETDHASCMDALDQLTLPLITTCPAFTEAM